MNQNAGCVVEPFMEMITSFRILKVQTPVAKVTYLTFITLVMALYLTGIGWLWQLGGVIFFSVQLITGRFSGGKLFMTWVGCILLLGSLTCGVWQFELALQFGHIWLRFPLPWWFVVFVLTAWVLAIVGEVRRKT
jgi:hypothetical protein